MSCRQELSSPFVAISNHLPRTSGGAGEEIDRLHLDPEAGYRSSKDAEPSRGKHIEAPSVCIRLLLFSTSISANSKTSIANRFRDRQSVHYRLTLFPRCLPKARGFLHRARITEMSCWRPATSDHRFLRLGPRTQTPGRQVNNDESVIHD